MLQVDTPKHFIVGRSSSEFGLVDLRNVLKPDDPSVRNRLLSFAGMPRQRKMHNRVPSEARGSNPIPSYSTRNRLLTQLYLDSGNAVLKWRQ